MAHFAYPENSADASTADEAHVQAFLADSGWVQTGIAQLTLDGLHRATSYAVPGCAAEVRISAISPTAEDVGLLRSLAGQGDRVLFLRERKLSEGEPSAGTYIPAKLDRLAKVLRLSREPPQPVLGIVAPGACPVERLAKWPLL